MPTGSFTTCRVPGFGLRWYWLSRQRAKLGLAWPERRRFAVASKSRAATEAERMQHNV